MVYSRSPQLNIIQSKETLKVSLANSLLIQFQNTIKISYEAPVGVLFVYNYNDCQILLNSHVYFCITLIFFSFKSTISLISLVTNIKHQELSHLANK